MTAGMSLLSNFQFYVAEGVKDGKSVWRLLVKLGSGVWRLFVLEGLFEDMAGKTLGA